jgi:hypothetical protein
MGMLEAGVGEPEVIEPVIEPNAGDRHAQVGHVGEIRQPHPAGFVDLSEDHLLVGAMQGPPRANPAFQRAARPGGQTRMAPLHLFENRHRPKARRPRQHRHDLSIEELGERIRPTAAALLLPGGGQLVVLLGAIGGGHADRRLGG